MKIFISLILLFIVGCTSNSKKSESSDPAASVNLTNQDFKKMPIVNYNASKDRYQTSIISALSNETMSQLDSNGIGLVANDKDPMSVMMAQCYKGNFENALKIADSIFNSYQKHPSYWNQLGSCHLLKGSERKALLFYNKSLELKQNYSPALNNIGVIYKKNGQDQKAHVAFDKASKSSPFAKTPRYNLAYLYLANGLADKSLQIFKGLLSQNPNEADILIGAGNSSALIERWSESLDFFLKVPDSLRTRGDVGLNMALAAFKLGKVDAARDILKRIKVSESDRVYADKLKQIIGE